MKEKGQRTLYYSDFDEDFVGAAKDAKKIDKSYEYIKNGFFWKTAAFFLYRIVATPIAFIYNRLFLRERYIGRRKLRCKEGYMLFINHTEKIGDAFLPSMLSFPKKAYVVVHPDNLSVPVIGGVTAMLGALPIPSDVRAGVNFNRAIHARLLEHSAIAVYPEGHLWEGCGFIRPFKAGALQSAVREGVKAFSVTRTYKKALFGYKSIIYIDGPFLPDGSIPRSESERLLSAQIMDAMQKRAGSLKRGRIQYIKSSEEKHNE